MRCSHCQTELPEGCRFCIECGRPLDLPCPSCGASNLARAKFCMQCGAPLAREHQPASGAPSGERARAEGDRAFPHPPAEGQDLSSGERRQITVLFCDLVGSTSLSGRLDPEDLRNVVRAYQEASDTVVRSHGGHVAQYLGDGLLVYFGYPQAHEDDGQRAVRTGLGILAAVAELNERLRAESDVELRVRVGIHTGLVVVGGMGGKDRREQLAVGSTPNVAARMQEIAEPGTVVVSEATAQLVEASFRLDDLGTREVKGVDTPVRVFRILGESDTGRHTVGRTPLVGREQELALLQDRISGAKEGAGHVVLLSAEGGFGKTRLVEAVRSDLEDQPHHLLLCRCSPYSQNSPFLPLADMVRRHFGFSDGDDPDEKLRKAEACLAALGRDHAKNLPLFASLLTLPTPAGASDLKPQQRRRMTLEALLALVRGLSRERLVAFIAEDLQWVDPSTEEFLGLLTQEAPTCSIIALFTCRPQFRPSWSMGTQITLGRLTVPQVDRLLRHLTGEKDLPAEVREQILAKTDGVPLFVEELTRMILESGMLLEREDRFDLNGPLPPLAIPATLQDSLMARLDRLSGAKIVAQIASCVGRECRQEVLQAVAPLEEAELLRELGRLVDSGLLHQHGVPPGATYIFRHALIRDAAYNSLLRSTRQKYHRKIADALIRAFPETVETQPELLAHHYTEAAHTEAALEYWYRAGKRAFDRSTHVEAIHHFEMGLDLLGRMPEGRFRDGKELEILSYLVPAYYSTRGYTAPEVGATCDRALGLCEKTGERRLRAVFLRGRWSDLLVRGEMTDALVHARGMVDHAREVGDNDFALEAHKALGMNLFFLGDLEEARTHLELVLERFDPTRHGSFAYVYGQDVLVTSLAFLAMDLWGLGYADDAVARCEEGLLRGREVGHVYSLTMALDFACWLFQFRREPERVAELAAEAGDVARKYHFGAWAVIADIVGAWARAVLGDWEGGLRAFLTALGVKQGRTTRSYYHSMLGEIYVGVGDLESALRSVEEGLAVTRESKDMWYEPELHRQRGEILRRLRGDDDPEAEACLRHALERTRQLHLRSLGLRAATSYGRWLGGRGRADEGRALLQEATGWFRQGRDTVDFREAEAALQALSGSSPGIPTGVPPGSG